MSEGRRTLPGVLVVDDDTILRAALAEILDQAGFQVSTASNGFTGLRLAELEHPRVMLLDVVLPELSGLEVLRELKAHASTHDIAVIVVTGQSSALSEARAAGADLVLEKPFDLDELLAAVHRALKRAPLALPTADGGPSVSPAVLPNHTPRPHPRHPAPTWRAHRGHP